VVSVRPAAAPAAPDLAHDRVKQRILAEGVPEPYLQALGVMTADGQVKAAQRAKFAQINEFLRLLAETGALTHWPRTPVEMVDFGCGSAALTFALYHYLNETLGIPARMTGVDLKADLIARHQQTAAELGWAGMRFVETAIADYAPPAAPDVVIALHACDTATDDAIAQGIRARSRLIVCAPCCHHNLQAQLALRPTPAPFAPVLRYGLFHERLGDVLTDTFRTLVLRAAGYKVDVVEFIAPEHTPRNVMLRAVSSGMPPDAAAAREYVELAEFWRVAPYLERALGDDLPF
jgi:SAM-dependent methyltransferase